MLRFIIIMLTAGIFLILTIPVLLIEWILGKRAPGARDRSSYHIIQWLFRLILWETGVMITTIGTENIPTDQAVLYIGNHRSCVDILLTYVNFPRPTGFVAKKETEKIPLFAQWMRNISCLFLDRKDLKQGLKTILTAIEKVKSGISIFIFPEGTRSRTEDELEMLPFHEGSFKVATKTNCPIIPVALSNTADIFEKHFPVVKPVHVIVEFGQPIYPDQLEKEDKKHIGAYTQGVILEMLKKNQEMV